MRFKSNFKTLLFAFAAGLTIIVFSIDSFGASPANDNLQNVETIIGLSGSLSSTNAEGTRQNAEPTHDTPTTVVYRTVWYQWTATESKPVIFEITEAEFDAAIAVYVGNNGFQFLEAPTRNNDTFGNRPRVEFAAVAGKTYKIVVGLFNDSTSPGGNFSLQWSTNDSPAYDNFANALTLESVNGGHVALTKMNGTKEPGEPVHIAGNKSIWFNFTNNLPVDRSMTFSTLSTDLGDTTVSVYTGENLSSLIPVVKNDNVGGTLQGRVTFLAKSGVTYRIAVDEGFAPNSGTSRLLWQITQVKDYTEFAAQFGQETQIHYDDAAEIAVFRPSNGTWYWLNSHDFSFGAVKFGQEGDTPVPADYDGDGRADIAVTRDTPNGKFWHILNSFDGSYRITQWGLAGDKPVLGDYDYDGRTDICIYRPSEGMWYINRSSDGEFTIKQFGLPDDIPVVGDFRNTPSGSDIAVYRPSNGTWYVFDGENTQFTTFGLPEDKPVVGDYDFDGRSDIAVFRPSDSTWYVLRSRTLQVQVVNWGLPGDIPLNGNFNNNSNQPYDFTVYRPSEGMWYIQKSEGTQFQYTAFGLSEDIPVSSMSTLAK